MSRPPKSLEAFFARCIPLARREEVLGDLSEKYTSPLQYFFLAARTIPFVIVSRLRRIDGPVFLLTDPLLIYGGFLFEEAWYRRALLLSGPPAFLRLAMPAALTWLYLLARDIFAPAPGKPAAFEPFGLITMVVFMGTAGSPDWLNGFFTAWILVSATRRLLPSDPNARGAWLASSWTVRRDFAVWVVPWVLLHFSGLGFRIGAAGLWVVLIVYYRLNRRAAK